MGDALKRRRLLIATAVAAAILGGVGAAAQAGLLSRAESGGNSSRGAGAAIGTAETGGDVIAVAETKASTTSQEGSGGASATLLRVGDTNVGEAPKNVGFNDALGPLTAGLPTEEFVDGGCDQGLAIPACAFLLASIVEEDEGDNFAAYATTGARVGDTGVLLLTSESEQDSCDGSSHGEVLEIQNTQTGDVLFSLDPSEDSESSCR